MMGTETKVGHTPGPWTQQAAAMRNVEAQFPAGPETIAVALDIGRTDETWGNTRQVVANARLIAAAPELLEAAQFAINVAHTCDCPFGEAFTPKSTCDCNYHDDYRKALAALAKATPDDSYRKFQANLASRTNGGAS